MPKGLVKDYDGPLLLGDIDTENLLLINVIYHRPRKETNWEDAVSVVLKDVRTGQKKLVQIHNPDMLYYVVKEEYRNFKYCPAYRPLSECEVHRVPYKKVLDDICEVGGDLAKDFRNRCKANGNGRAIKNLHKYPFVLGSDVNYVDYFRCEWALHYHNSEINKTLTTAYLDIEVDAIDIPGFPEPGSCPINAVSLVDPQDKIVYVFLLRNEKNPQIDEFEDTVNDFKKDCHKAFDDSYGEFDYKFYLFDEAKELVMIQQLFALIHEKKWDFLLIWNMAFDIPYIIARIEELGADPRDIMCHPDFERKELFYHKDTFHYDFKTRNDSFTISSYTVFLDQMMQYIKIRKQNLN
jgi:DNA polymerase elongation subunit (family B)